MCFRGNVLGAEVAARASSLSAVSDVAVRQPVIGCVVREGVAVEARQPLAGAEPQEAPRVAHDLVDLVVRQAIGGSVSLQRQALGVDW